MDKKFKYSIAIHGGAGAIPKTVPEKDKKEYIYALKDILQYGKELLEKRHTALDTVELVVNKFEDCPLFNAGKGAVFNSEGRNELNAAIMDGRDRSCGAVTCVTRIKNPISLARIVMEKSPHILLCGDGAEKFAKQHGMKFVRNSYFFTQKRYDQWLKMKEKDITALDHSSDLTNSAKGTVGCVARDIYGDLAAATSTGGMTNKKYGRIGDTPIIGSGTYADNETCAVSCTGTGEEFMRTVAGHEIHSLIKYKKMNIKEALDHFTVKILKPDTGGLIAVDKYGDHAYSFNSKGMYRGSADSEGFFEVRIWE
ncbi:MAG TPA: isoaspartyl peptidase/L-asparaginase [Clostridiales bacterium]|nr:isoaspartyl peptidase/L-asparaginase [Clostridiales bacterium]HQP70805.1 isoaspartyl peptidase/L-asparaginase [Clostridiales bacterium]